MDSETIRAAADKVDWARQDDGWESSAWGIATDAARAYADLLEAQERGEALVVVKVECGECGGTGSCVHGVVGQHGGDEYLLPCPGGPCPSCGGTGKDWPRWAHEHDTEWTDEGGYHYEIGDLAEALDAIVAAQREEAR